MSTEAHDIAGCPAAAQRPRSGPRFIELDAQQRVDTGELAAGLLGDPARIAPKYFYDRLGSALFTAICELPEYYPTRTEVGIHQRDAAAIAEAVGPGSTLIDLGAGDCAKADRLIGALRPAQYVAVDISVDFLRESLARVQGHHPALDMIGIGLDFTRQFRLPATVRRARRVMFYPGSSIGNFSPPQAAAFLAQLRGAVDDDGGLLIGVDLAKDAAIVEPAYDDALGVTAAFNLNVLRHVNRLLGADFDPAHWRHRAFLNPAQGRIEMHLVARRSTLVRWPGGQRSFAEGEAIHTENSYKYTPRAFEAMLTSSGFSSAQCWADPDGWFAVYYARAGAAK
ncbi:MAG TPA: L-histidine N(alpha)-methyltransferase [Burkholderiaceae bacterium]|nr:L-histidine N(alpha)-methyltransferase [Burkholderiaceae bacterium]